MADHINDGGPAFPAPDASREHFGTPDCYLGLSLRDYHAAKAMQGMVAAGGSGTDANTRPEIALRAYLMADEMLKARAAR